jgi:hypothetical protein
MSPEDIKPTTLGEVVIHLQTLAGAIQAMRDDFHTKWAEMAVRAEVDQQIKALKDRLETLEHRYESETLWNKFNSFLALVTRVAAAGAAIVVLAGGLVYVVRLADGVAK